MTYSEKLKDPRWQQARLKILERDEWTCQKCASKEKSLHVHHSVYWPGEEPWDAPVSTLVTLCLDCHADEHDEHANAVRMLLLTFAEIDIRTGHEIESLLDSVDSHLQDMADGRKYSETTRDERLEAIARAVKEM